MLRTCCIGEENAEVEGEVLGHLCIATGESTPTDLGETGVSVLLGELNSMGTPARYTGVVGAE